MYVSSSNVEIFSGGLCGPHTSRHPQINSLGVTSLLFYLTSLLRFVLGFLAALVSLSPMSRWRQFSLEVLSSIDLIALHESSILIYSMCMESPCQRVSWRVGPLVTIQHDTLGVQKSNLVVLLLFARRGTHEMITFETVFSVLSCSSPLMKIACWAM